MNKYISPERRAYITALRRGVSLADYVSLQGVPLRKASGNNLKACCPFHTEKTPSFFVETAGNFYKCFGCGQGGDIYSFVQSYYRVDFAEAVRRVENHVTERGLVITTKPAATRTGQGPATRTKAKTKIKAKKRLRPLKLTRLESLTPRPNRSYRYNQSKYWLPYYFRAPATHAKAWRLLQQLAPGYAQQPVDHGHPQTPERQYYQDLRCRVAMAYEPLLIKMFRIYRSPQWDMLGKSQWQDLFQHLQVKLLETVDAYALDPQNFSVNMTAKKEKGIDHLSSARRQQIIKERATARAKKERRFVPGLRHVLSTEMQDGFYRLRSGEGLVNASTLMTHEERNAGSNGEAALDRAAVRSGLIDRQGETMHSFADTRDARRLLGAALRLREINLVDAGLMAGAYPDIFTGLRTRAPLTTAELATHYDIGEQDVTRRLGHTLRALRSLANAPATDLGLRRPDSAPTTTHSVNVIGRLPLK